MRKFSFTEKTKKQILEAIALLESIELYHDIDNYGELTSTPLSQANSTEISHFAQPYCLGKV